MRPKRRSQWPFRSWKNRRIGPESESQIVREQNSLLLTEEERIRKTESCINFILLAIMTNQERTQRHLLVSQLRIFFVPVEGLCSVPLGWHYALSKRLVSGFWKGPILEFLHREWCSTTARWSQAYKFEPLLIVKYFLREKFDGARFAGKNFLGGRKFFVRGERKFLCGGTASRTNLLGLMGQTYELPR